MYSHVGICTGVKVPSEAPEPGVRNDCELPSMAQDLCKNKAMLLTAKLSLLPVYSLYISTAFKETH